MYRSSYQDESMPPREPMFPRAMIGSRERDSLAQVVKLIARPICYALTVDILC